MRGQNKDLVKSLTGVLPVLAVVAVSFYFVADVVAGETEPNDRLQAKILENIKPVGEVNIGTLSTKTTAPAAVATSRSGKAVYDSSCMACHGTGVAGAPKVGDKAAWGARAAKGVDGLLKSALSGLNAMPPKGTCATCSDDELKAAIEYMLKETGL